MPRYIVWKQEAWYKQIGTEIEANNPEHAKELVEQGLGNWIGVEKLVYADEEPAEYWPVEEAK